MRIDPAIIPPADEGDIKGAEKVFEAFYAHYYPVLTKVDQYLAQIVEEFQPEFAEGYRTWQAALHDLRTGLFLMTKKIPLPDKERFVEAMKMFSFNSAVQFLFDLCRNCRLNLEREWTKQFQRHMELLIFSFSILSRAQQPQLAR